MILYTIAMDHKIIKRTRLMNLLVQIEIRILCKRMSHLQEQLMTDKRQIIAINKIHFYNNFFFEIS